MAAFRPAVLVAVVALAAASLVAEFSLVYDPWAWLVWGREIAGFDLDTSAGPSWKPLPVLVATLLAPAGDAAPELWAFVARIGWLAAPVLAWTLAARLVFPDRLATRIADRWAPRRMRQARVLAGVIAAAGVLLLFDPFTPWWRQFAGGLTEPLLVALILGAVHRELDGHSGQALALGFAAALLRPECWPLLGVFGWLLWRRAPSLRPVLAAMAVALPLLWLVPDVVGSGDPLTGAVRAREGSGAPPWEALEAIGRSLNLALAGLWAAAAYAVWSARRNGERAIPVIAAAGLAWIAIVAVLAAGGYAGLPRFAAPAGAVACVLGAVGVVRFAAAVDGMRTGAARMRAIAGLAAVGIALIAQGGVRVALVPGDISQAVAYSDSVGDLTELAGALDEAQVRECGSVYSADFLVSTALAWRLDVPLRTVSTRLEAAPRRGTVFVLAASPAELRERVARRGVQVGSEGRWSAYAISCASASGAAIAGGSGAVR